jgi:hypothetical protein
MESMGVCKAGMGIPASLPKATIKEARRTSDFFAYPVICGLP